MNALVYNPYWETLGGGERYSAFIAKVLIKNNFKVSINTNLDILAKISSKFRIDISKSIPATDNQFRIFDLVWYVSDGSIPFPRGKINLLHFQVPFKNIYKKNIYNDIKKRGWGFICNSEFTKSVIDKEYEVKSKVLYPPVDTEYFSQVKIKENRILYVGRFSNLTQAKNHHLLIDAFRLLKSKIKGWDLYIAGSTGIGTREQDIARIKQMAHDVGNIHIILDPSINELKELYSTSTFFWSTSGMGIDENKSPQMTEHFGISVVESMSAGCIPVISNKGGFREILNGDTDGRLVDSPDQLAHVTLDIISSNNIEKMKEDSIKRSSTFSYDNFEKTFVNIITRNHDK